MPRYEGDRINRKPVICSVCFMEIDGTDAEVKILNKLRHMMAAHGIPKCSPDAY